ncbi:MAG TPA: hypothetical protein VLJ57_01290 [Burkholderiaceae bacterium]|nr:hypothetical protein [Burkholderiaceae bacterium]
MFLFKPVRWLAIFWSLTAVTVYAQTVASPSGTSTAPSTASAITYQSALEGYQPYRDEKIKPWKESNDTVGRVGGWRAYAKEAAEPASQGNTAPAASGAPNPHAGHGKP